MHLATPVFKSEPYNHVNEQFTSVNTYYGWGARRAAR